jgi:peptidoglycan/LPS O-acetylase OafA/YrhL
MLVRELERDGRIAFRRFYARRIKRLLPAAAAVLLVTAVFSFLILSPLRRAEAGWDVVASALYSVNWLFASQQTDYLAPEVAPSPVQHFWSLCVEEQFYVIWPLLLFLVARAALRRGAPLRPTLLAAVAAVTVGSFAWELHQSTANQPFAFFGTPARVWELGLGAVLALALPTVARIPAGVRAVLGWAGLGTVLVSMVVIDEATRFPGTAALWPVLGTAAVIAAGSGPRAADVRGLGAGPVSALDVPFMRGTGRISYSLYLWHWPPLVLVGALLGRELGVVAGTVVVVLSAVPAYLSWRWIEEPFRRSEVLVALPHRAFVLAAALTAAAVVVGLALTASGSGANARYTVTESDGDVVQVDPAAAREDLPVSYEDGCQQGYAATQVRLCTYGDTDADRTIALVGDSHALQWVPAFVAVAEREKWRLLVGTKSSCALTTTPIWLARDSRTYTECTSWSQSALDELAVPGAAPDVVVLVSRGDDEAAVDGEKRSIADSADLLRDGFADTIGRFRSAGSHVVVVGNQPEPTFDVPDCLSENSEDPGACDFDRDRLDGMAIPSVLAAADVRATRTVDVTELVCPEVVCSPISRGTVAYRDIHHLTATWVERATPDLERLFADARVKGF